MRRAGAQRGLCQERRRRCTGGREAPAGRIKLIYNLFLPANAEFSCTSRITRTLIHAHCTLDATFVPSACISCSLPIASLSHQRYHQHHHSKYDKLWCKEKKQQAQQEEPAFELKLPGSSIHVPNHYGTFRFGFGGASGGKRSHVASTTAGSLQAPPLLLNPGFSTHVTGPGT